MAECYRLALQRHLKAGFAAMAEIDSRRLASRLRIFKDRQMYAVAALVFFVALALRLVFVAQWHQTPLSAFPLLDANAYHQWAIKIARGDIFHDNAFYQSPLYPYLLGTLYALFGENAVLGSIVNAIFNALTCSLLSLVAYRCFGLSASVFTGFFASFYRPYVFFSAPLLKESLGLFLLAVFMLLTLQTLQRGKLKSFFLVGLTLGLATLVRGNVLLLGAAFLIFAYQGFSKNALQKYGVFLVGIFLAIAPATLHNAVVSKDFVPITYNGGFNFYIGNSPFSIGEATYPPGISTDPLTGEEGDTKALAEKALGRPLKPSEISDYWFRMGLDSISHNLPLAFIRIVNKLWLTIDDSEHGDNYNIAFTAKHFDTLLRWPMPGFSIALFCTVFAATGMEREKRRPVAVLLAFALVYVLSIIPFYVTDRYRLPLTVFIFPLTGAFIPVGYKLIRDMNLRRLFPATVIAMFFLWAGNVLVYGSLESDAKQWGLLAHVAKDAGKYEDAILYLEKGMSLAPHSLNPETYLVGVQSAEKLCDSVRAANYMDHILRRQATR